MMQQINLLGDPPNPIERVLSMQSLATVITAVVLGVVVLSGFVTMQTDAVARNIETIELHQRGSAKALAAFVAANPAKKSSRLLARELRAKSGSLDVVQKLIDTISSSNKANRSGFSGYMEGFAQQRAANLWLTGFELSSGGRFMRISGNALEPKSVPGFLRGLSSETIFNGREFSDLKISRDAEEPKPWVRFSVQTKSVEEEV